VTKPFLISKKIVWDAYLQVKARKGSAGVDAQSVEDFERDLRKNLYRIWNRMSSGTYFPPPVLEVVIPKRDGGERKLGVPTISDRIAQTVVKKVLEPMVEPQFHRDSYGYRPGRSAHDAVGRARERCWQFNWVLDLDVQSFFDTLDHALVMRAVKRYTDCRWVLLYVERWLKAPVQLQDGTLEQRTSGTPQGGVISPLLANIFLHLAFDQWMQDTHPEVPFERYADDVIVHCRTQAQAEVLRRSIEARLARCRLRVHPQKTRIAYCKDSNRRESHSVQSFDFLGFTFRPRLARNRRGVFFVSFSPAVSRRAATALRQELRRSYGVPRRTGTDLDGLARLLNPMLRGWIRYYAAFRPSALHTILRSVDRSLVRWAMRKYKRFKRASLKADRWLSRVRARQPLLFAHWAFAKESSATG
jgi:RNA-directed DNA polymerase